MARTRVSFIGGRYDMRHAYLSNTPKTLEIKGHIYQRIDDPETGEFLGAYAAKEGA